MVSSQNENEVKITKTEFEGLLIIEKSIFEDHRGHFYESYNKKSFSEAGIEVEFIQDNQSYSHKNVIRGLHFQKPPFAQTKLVRVLWGTVLDVVVDLRSSYPTFKKVFTIELSHHNRKQVLIPAGCAHGFSVLSDGAQVLYKIDKFFNRDKEAGIYYDDPALSIDWRVDKGGAVVSLRDQQLPLLSDYLKEII